MSNSMFVPTIGTPSYMDFNTADTPNTPNTSSRAIHTPSPILTEYISQAAVEDGSIVSRFMVSGRPNNRVRTYSLRARAILDSFDRAFSTTTAATTPSTLTNENTKNKGEDMKDMIKSHSGGGNGASSNTIASINDNNKSRCG